VNSSSASFQVGDEISLSPATHYRYRG
jgi:hypothetical protein